MFIDNMRNTANRLVSKYGSNIVYHVVTPLLVNGVQEGLSEVDNNLIGVQDEFDNSVFNISEVQTGDIKISIDALSLEASSITPQTKDKITYMNEKYRILSIKNESAQNKIAVYYFHLRK